MTYILNKIRVLTLGYASLCVPQSPTSWIERPGGINLVNFHPTEHCYKYYKDQINRTPPDKSFRFFFLGMSVLYLCFKYYE